MDRLHYLHSAQRIVIKVGTHVLADEEGRLKFSVIALLADQIAALAGLGKEVVLVSSGAIAAGRAILGKPYEKGNIAEKQALAAVGQSHLMHLYQRAFEPHEIKVGQVLLTNEDLSHRKRYLNAKNTFVKLIQYRVIPIVNENDTVTVEEIKFGDNDNLSAMVSILVDADLLILLTDTEGLYASMSGSRQEPPKPLSWVSNITPDILRMASGPDGMLGTGGMRTKVEAARMATEAGLSVIIAYGRRPRILEDIFKGVEIGTFFVPLKDRLARKKHWIAYTLRKKGELVLDDGAVHALVYRGKSLLASGITDVIGTFENGQMVSCIDRNGKEWARGLSNYSSDEIQKIMGKKSSQIEKVLGYTIREEIIHRDSMVILKD